ncbi:Na+/H+ antiporter NhaC family protein [Pseudoxanthomonas mexicana]
MPGLYYTAQGEAMGFYQLRAPVAILPALALGVWLARRRGVPAQQTLLQGMGDGNVMLMCLIFLLAGAFATVSKAIGAVDAVVALGLGALPAGLILPGLFLVAAFVSLSIGTSMGTLAAVVPIALGVADAAGLDRVLVTSAVLGGAMFGDNLSIISDTTIAATRSQGAEMRDKFRENFRIALPAAIATIVLLATLGDAAPVEAPDAASPWLVLPYVVVLGLALAGLDVVLVLGIGLVVSGVFGFVLAQEYDVVSFAGDIYLGFESMVEITLLSILIGGLAALIKATGGLAWLAQVIAKFARGHTGRRAGEISIAALAAGSDALTANNTVAILVTGSLAKDIAQRHGISPRRAASVLDIFACVVQGVLPYGAQILLAASLAAVSPLALAGSVYYCWLLALSAIGFMLWPRRAAPQR